MFFEGQLGYVTASYMISALIFSCVILWVLVDRNRQKKLLLELEGHGLDRQRNRRGDQ